jgi:hypothetical protein
LILKSKRSCSKRSPIPNALPYVQDNFNTRTCGHFLGTFRDCNVSVHAPQDVASRNIPLHLLLWSTPLLALGLKVLISALISQQPPTLPGSAGSAELQPIGRSKLNAGGGEWRGMPVL